MKPTQPNTVVCVSTCVCVSVRCVSVCLCVVCVPVSVCSSSSFAASWLPLPPISRKMG